LASLTPADIRDVAERVAEEAGALIKRRVGAELLKTKQTARDLLTAVDGEVELLLKERILGAFPDHGILGEESVAPGSAAAAAALDAALEEGSSDWLWIVDPIDGTTNFVHGSPLSAVSIGVAYRGELVVGVVRDPFAEETFSAHKGGGCFLNGESCSVGDAANAKEALVSIGYGGTDEGVQMFLKGMEALSTLPVRHVRMLGSAAIMFAWVACGRLSAYVEADLCAWDSAGGAVLVAEAGGEMGTLSSAEEGFSVRSRAVIGSCGGTAHQELSQVLMDAGFTGLPLK